MIYEPGVDDHPIDHIEPEEEEVVERIMSSFAWWVVNEPKLTILALWWTLQPDKSLNDVLADGVALAADLASPGSKQNLNQRFAEMRQASPFWGHVLHRSWATDQDRTYETPAGKEPLEVNYGLGL